MAGSGMGRMPRQLLLGLRSPADRLAAVGWPTQMALPFGGASLH